MAHFRLSIEHCRESYNFEIGPHLTGITNMPRRLGGLRLNCHQQLLFSATALDHEAYLSYLEHKSVEKSAEGFYELAICDCTLCPGVSS